MGTLGIGARASFGLDQRRMPGAGRNGLPAIKRSGMDTAGELLQPWVNKETMNHWLVKQEPESYAFSQLVADGKTAWTGVRNFQARNFLRAMQAGDRVLYYHSGKDKAIVGTATVSRASFPDPTADSQAGGWVAVELEAGKPLKRPLSLAAVKGDPALGAMLLVSHSRLSVMPVSPEEYRHIIGLTGG